MAPQLNITLSMTLIQIFSFIFIAFVCNAKSFANAIIFSLCSSLQQIWTDWQKLLVELSAFVKLAKCVSIRTHYRNVM